VTSEKIPPAPSGPERPDRRTFLSRAAAVAASGAVLGPAASIRAGREPEQRTTSMTIRKAVKYEMVNVEGASVTERFALVKELGFDGIEPGRPSGVPVEVMKRASDETGLPVHGVVCSTHWRDPLSSPDAEVRARGRAGLEQALDDAAVLGASTVLLVPAVVSKEVSYADAWARSQEEIAKVLPRARDLGLRIAIENVWNHFLLSPLEAVRYVDDLGRDAVGWYFDVGNIVNYGWPEHWIRTLGTRILKIDGKEFSRGKRNEEGLWAGFGVRIGDGDCDWAAVMSALREIGFAGEWFTAEVGGGGRERLAEIKARMDRVLV